MTKETQQLDVVVEKVRLKDLAPQKLNARFMTAEQMRRLTDNLKRDGELTSTVLVYAPPGKPREILSGHHRVEAAIAAGIEEAHAHVIRTEISDDRKTAIQLSHNAIVGQDDPALLAELYANLGNLDEKLYSGLTDDDVMDFDGLDISALSSMQPKYMEVSLMFLEGQEQEFKEVLEQVAEEAKKSTPKIFHAARNEDWDTFFNAMVGAKEESGIYNSATALRIVCELALERLEQLKPEGEEDQ